MAKRRVVITGIGILSPLGNDLASSWDGIVNGRSGIGPITHFDATNFATRIAGEVKGFDATEWIAPKDVKKMDPFVHYGVAGGLMAIRDAGIEVREEAMPLDVVHRAEEVFLTGTTRDVHPVAAVDDRELDAPGPVTARLAEIFAQRASERLDP